MEQLKLYGLADEAARFLEKNQLSDATQWAKFVDVYRSHPDSENQGWRGEYWGKMMRGAAMVYAYTQSESLYKILTDTVKDMMTVMEEDGRVSTYERGKEFDSWDLWSRKYVLLGCEYYLEICKDEALRTEIVRFLARLLDYIILHIGDGEGQKSITDASRSWFGVNSSSILEPAVRLYRLTGEKRYLDFAAYIVKCGGAKGINIFDLAYENKLLPYQYGVSKAYEMTSCFEGLLEYYKVTGIERYKTAVLNYAYAVLKSEFSIIGSSGITHELFDHTVTRQTVVHDDVMQETCVTVTLMKFCASLLDLTGDAVFADAIERSFYNAYLGAINTEHKICDYIYQKFVKKQGFERVVDTYLAFDSYSPLTPGKRGKKVGGNQLMPDLSYYGCCACIGAAGVGVFLENAVCVKGDTVTVNFFEKGEARFTVGGVAVTMRTDTEYPVSGDITLSVKAERPVRFVLRVRIPAWAGEEGYRVYEKDWSEDAISLSLPMQVVFHHPISWDTDTVYTDMSHSGGGWHVAEAMAVKHRPEDDKFVALTRGPLTLGADSRLGKAADSVFSFASEGKLCSDRLINAKTECVVKLAFTDKNGEAFYLVDYASAGRDWESEIAAWLPIE